MRIVEEDKWVITVDREAISNNIQLPDSDVVRRVLEGEKGLFEVLMRRYNQRVYRVARAVVGDDALAEDVVQESYLNAYANLGQYDGTGAFAAWLTRIALHEALRVKKREGRWIHHDVQQEANGDGVPYHQQKNPERDVSLQSILTTSIDTLPPALRVVFVLRQVEDLSVSDTADSLGISEANVKTRFYRARKSLRASLERILGDELEHMYGFDGARCDRVVFNVFARLEA